MLIVLSLDSESSDWLEDRLTAGDLPHLARLVERGRKLPLDAARLAGVAYPSLYTGLRPADLGLYFPVQWSAARQRVVSWRRLPLPGPTIFERIEATGRRITVIDPPECAALRLKRSLVISGLQFRARVLLHPWSTNDAEFRRLLQAAGGPAPHGDEVFGQPTATGLVRLRQTLINAPRRLRAAALDILRREPPDCLWLNCCAMHIAAHQFFDLGLLPEADRAALASTRLDVARGYDSMIGALRDAAPTADFLVFFAKGMGAAHGWEDLLPDMLRRVLGESAAASEPITGVRSLVPLPLRRAVADTLPDNAALDLMAWMSNPGTDWAKTRAFCLPSDCPGFIRLNLAGREPHGCVRPDDVPALLEQIRDGLCSFRHPDGEPPVERIIPPEAMFGAGNRLDAFPDLIVEWHRRPNLFGTGLRSPKFGEVLRRGVGTGRSGQHGPGAFAVLPGLNPRDTGPVQVPVQIEDIPATILSYLGVDRAGLPGRPLF